MRASRERVARSTAPTTRVHGACAVRGRPRLQALPRPCIASTNVGLHQEHAEQDRRRRAEKRADREPRASVEGPADQGRLSTVVADRPLRRDTGCSQREGHHRRSRQARAVTLGGGPGNQPCCVAREAATRRHLCAFLADLRTEHGLDASMKVINRRFSPSYRGAGQCSWRATSA
jgi:hypothetical protein